ncbi:MAG: hypothetical protein LKE53_07505 [Oscillospiraceae bacterium]|jgi:hypothetical protein|nr:hypothetical protein [Oscillospiraceae bacterium]MDD3261316.1 hypothetical protein [Oscillospiraceae bacterium]
MKVLKKIFLLFLSLYGLWKLLTGFEHTKLIADLSEFPPIRRAKAA